MVKDGFTNGPLFVEQLKIAGKITEEQISFYITNTNGQSYCDLGAYKTDAIRDGDAAKIKWVAMPKELLFWYAFVDGIVYDDPSKTRMSTVGFTSRVKINPAPAIFDTGTSLIYVPLTQAEDFMYRILWGKKYIYYNGMFIVNCEEQHKYQDVYLRIDGHLYQISKDDYFIKITEGEVSQCLLAFVASPSEYWLLGDAFLMGYYSIHDNIDHANARVGFVPHSNSHKPDIAAMPASDFKYEFEDLQWEKTWLYEYYWFWQIEAWADVPVLDAVWIYWVPAVLWEWVMGPQTVLIKAFHPGA